MHFETREIASILILAASLAVFLPLLVWSPVCGGMMGFGWSHMILVPIAFLILIGIGIYYLVAGLTVAGKPADRDRSAIQILKERYARGEITKDQYDEMRRRIEE
ncbi:MAG: SHOCT domain-containing protein [Candidatus Brockarchaeota archaeon]|nr:SHOCT domain-containing protein [Candidatus Brockarchaeota archaeon]MBO3808929.1 SHOCT domain-containing protein [Candidatus Brockarchaeota archaeon]